MSNTLDRLPTEYVTCRAYGHPWQPSTVSRIVNTRGIVVEYRADLECPRCETRKTQIYTADGRILGTGYVYPPEYRKRPDEAPVTIGSARIEYFGRTHRILTIRQEQMESEE